MNQMAYVLTVPRVVWESPNQMIVGSSHAYRTCEIDLWCVYYEIASCPSKNKNTTEWETYNPNSKNEWPITKFIWKPKLML